MTRLRVTHRKVEEVNYGKHMDLATGLEGFTRCRDRSKKARAPCMARRGSRTGDLTGGDSAVICRNAWVPSHLSPIDASGN